jgi:hypothetical protein
VRPRESSTPLSGPISKQFVVPPGPPPNASMQGRSISTVGVIVTVAVAVLLAVGMYLLVKPS